MTERRGSDTVDYWGMSLIEVDDVQTPAQSCVDTDDVGQVKTSPQPKPRYAAAVYLWTVSI